MGMEDRDWYRDRRIDWERGGLRERKRKKGALTYAFWLLAAAAALSAAWLWMGPG
jgi:hypothetical protein